MSSEDPLQEQLKKIVNIENNYKEVRNRVNIKPVQKSSASEAATGVVTKIQQRIMKNEETLKSIESKSNYFSEVANEKLNSIEQLHLFLKHRESRWKNKYNYVTSNDENEDEDLSGAELEESVNVSGVGPSIRISPAKADPAVDSHTPKHQFLLPPSEKSNRKSAKKPFPQSGVPDWVDQAADIACTPGLFSVPVHGLSSVKLQKSFGKHLKF